MFWNTCSLIAEAYHSVLDIQDQHYDNDCDIAFINQFSKQKVE